MTLTFRRLLLMLGAALLAFALWSLATLPRSTALYGAPDRPLSGAGGVMPVADGDWPSTGRDPGGSQWSPLAQVTPENVSRLRQAWVHRSGDFRPGGTYDGTRLEAIPLVAGDTLYYCTPFQRVFALDAVTGKERWNFDPFSGPRPLFKGAMKPGHCRGVALWTDPAPVPGKACAVRVYRASGDRAIVALDAATGRPCEDFGAEAGHPGYVSHADYDPLGESPISATSPPIVVGDVLVAAAGAYDAPQDAANGIVRGFDARTGALRWAFDPIPAEHARQTGAANVWTLLSADPARRLVFLATSSPSPDFFGGNRKFDMPHVSAVVALSTDTGKPVWHYQIIRHDVWDYDLPAHPMLVSIRKDGRLRDVVIQPTKSGMVFVLDRDTGQPVFPVREQPVPASRVPGEQLSPTQKVPVRPGPLGRPRLTRDDMFGLTPLDRAWCRAKFDSLRYEGPFTPPDPQGALIFPSTMGGANWGGAAYDPATNLLVIKSENLATTMAINRRTPAFDNLAKGFMNRVLPGTDLVVTGDVMLSPLGIPCAPPPWGTLMAIDMSSGEKVWQVPLGQARRFGITLPAGLGWGSPSVGGPIVTGGGLVFIGATLDSRFRALDVRTGRELWQTPLPAPGMAVPITYAIKGRQYVTIAAGGNAFAGTNVSDALVTYALEPHALEPHALEP